MQVLSIEKDRNLMLKQRLLTGCMALAVLFGTQKSNAQSLDASPLLFAYSKDRIVSTNASRTLAHGEIWTHVSLGYANDSAVSHFIDGSVNRLVHHRIRSDLAIGIGLLGRLEFNLGMPFYLRQLGDNLHFIDRRAESGVGDLRLGIKASLISYKGFSLGIMAETTMPTGRKEDLMGEGEFTFIPRLIVDYRHPIGLLLAFNTALRVRDKHALLDLPLDEELLFNLGAEQSLGLHQLFVGAEVNASLGVGEINDSDSLFEERKTPIEVLGLIRWKGKFVQLSFASGLGVTQGYGAADIRLLFSIDYAPFVEKKKHPAALIQKKDEPTLKPPPPLDISSKTFDRLAADDPDKDGDGIINEKDKCPLTPEDMDKFEDNDGCPEDDNDHDGIKDIDDKCPNEPESVNGFKDDDGCPDQGKSRIELQGKDLKLKDSKIYFRSGSDILEKRSIPILNELSAALKALWIIRKLQIEGHTDSQGDTEMNVDLSERRARRVRQYLIDKGVAAHRLKSIGFGPTRPIASNKKRKGRAENRRVAFKVLEKVDPNTKTIKGGK